MEELVFECECCGVEYWEEFMNEVGEHYICDACKEEIK